MFSYLIGSLSRIFTTIQEVDDKLILYGFIAGFSLNIILAAQMIYYWKRPTKKFKQPQVVIPAVKPKAKSTGVASKPKSSAKAPSTRRRG